MNMTIKDISEKSLSRSNRWHPGGLSDWSVLEWAGAAAGEAGECCNAAKKLKRLDTNMATHNEEGRHYRDREAACKAVAKEAADTILYAILVIQAAGHSPEEVLRAVFNEKSMEYGFPERI